jgi:hypothetical protein
MNNGFAYLIVFIFSCAAGYDFTHGMPARGFFYLLSAAINVSVLYLR